MRSSRFFRIFISLFIVIMVFSIIIMVFSTRLLRSKYLDAMIENLRDVSIAAQTFINLLIQQEEWHELEGFIKNIYQETGIRLTLIHPDGSIMADSLRDFREMESHRNRPEVRIALQGEENYTTRYSTTIREEMLYLASPILREGNIIAVIRLAVFLDEMHLVLHRLRNIILLVAILMMLASLGIAYFISKKLAFPVNEWVQAFQRVANSELETRILPRQEEPEMKELAEQFNKMTEQIKSIFHDLSLQSEELNVIISAIQSGIALLDEKGKFILSNDQFKRIFSLTTIKEKYFWEVIRNQQLSERVSSLIEKKQNFSVEIEFSQKDYLCSGTYIGKKNKAILVVQDISYAKKLVQVKKDLISNLSHELRTPLTSIKGYIETIEEDKEEDKLERKRYIQIIKRNTERLINIVNDLLLLSELEDKGEKLEIERFNLASMMESLNKMFEPTIKEKGYRFHLDISEGTPEIEADAYKIEQMLINLIDNAIKYTEKGEISITIQLLPVNKVQIVISDTGIGIKKDDLNRIFERFYVTNKARSRKHGGTGLGLSIVKHIVILHKGLIEVESQPGIGTKFTVILPVQQP